MIPLIYRIIYSACANKVLRNVNKALSPILPPKIKIPPSGVLRIVNQSGSHLNIKTNQTSYLTKQLFWLGYQNFEYTDIFIRLIKKVNVFYDIGANIGYYSLLARMENSNVRVVGFEPASGPLSYFRENVRLNNYKDITIEDVALSDREGEIKFFEIRNKKYKYLQHNLAGESNTGSKTTDRNFVPTIVKTTTLDNYARSANEKAIELIKMDTEGTEHMILEKAEMVLGTMRPIIICETLFNTNESALEAVLSKYGYKFFNHTEDGLKEVETLQRATDNGVRNSFFVHPDKVHLIAEFVK